IETIEKTTDTIITLTTEKKIMVEEEPEVIIERIKEFRREINCPQLKKS
ncbi:MAG: flagellar protein, partial [Clostridia bacterium]|nr:flagellar protein [Clostridia bacterium]